MDVVPWLLEGPPWVRYRTRLDLLGEPADAPEVEADRSATLADPQAQDLLAGLAAWPGPVLTNHKSAGHPIHQLVFAADLGLGAGDPGVSAILDRILEHRSDEGPFQVLINIPTHFGGTGEDAWSWTLCDAPLLLYTLAQMGLAGDPRVQSGVHYLVGLLRDNGWPCAASPELGRFRGPGSKGDPCPYANLVMLRLLAVLPEWRDGPAARTGGEALLDLWARSWDAHPYLFRMGTDFRKLKAPLVWYDILHVLDVLSRFPALQQDDRLQEMAAIVAAKADAAGRFTPESVWKAWNAWEFGQKKAPSRWLTLLACRALGRLTR
jgi:hypothetical protein